MPFVLYNGEGPKVPSYGWQTSTSASMAVINDPIVLAKHLFPQQLATKNGSYNSAQQELPKTPAESPATHH